MESFLASRNYCLLGSCRRQNLLMYFGEEIGEECANCDNCMSGVKRQRDLMRETLLLISCIRDCGERWGINLPINVLRGSHCKKVIENSFHKLPIHGLGKQISENWWKSLSCILINQDYLVESVRGTYRFISLTDRANILLDDNTSGSKPLYFYLTTEMISEEENIEDELEALIPEQESKAELFTEVESKLYQFLITLRSKLAKDRSAAPYAICGDQVLRSFTKTRPSNKDSMCMVDGVNMNFVDKYSDIFLHYITEKCKELDLQLDYMIEDERNGNDDNTNHEENPEDVELLNEGDDGWPSSSSPNDILYLVNSFKGV